MLGQQFFGPSLCQKQKLQLLNFWCDLEFQDGQRHDVPLRTDDFGAPSRKRLHPKHAIFAAGHLEIMSWDDLVVHRTQPP